ncbi:MAG: response regulator [Planctomycetia bacterium]|nr:response regulator [Planctomycetia bacterium]
MALNILVVDDSSVVRSVILKSLRLADCDLGTLHEATNGQEGLEVMAQHWIDVAFVDINMPLMDGEEMIRHIRQNPVWADLPIVVVSTEGSETRVERLKQMGARFIHKPFPPEAIRRVVQEITGAKHELNA